MNRPDQIVAAPAGARSPQLAIAACRSGALGLVDLQWASAEEGWGAALRVDRQVRSPFGLILGADAAEWLARIGGESGTPRWSLAHLQTVVLADDAPEFSQAVAAARQLGLRVLVQTVTTHIRSKLAESPVDGVILKGHESGGRIGDETAFVLLQRWRHEVAGTDLEQLPYWVQGGVGPHTAAACRLAGARGVVLDSQVLLAREAGLTTAERSWIAALDGGETRVVGAEFGRPVRVIAPPGSKGSERLYAEAARLAAAQGELPGPQLAAEWRAAIAESLAQGVRLWGQDVALAKPLAAQETVGHMLSAVLRQSEESLRVAAELQPLAEGAPLARSHGTRFPLLQGPMTRVSDVAPFAASVAEAGALPFLALALLRGPEVAKLLEETVRTVGDRPWGVGILGFLPTEIRQEQTAEILRVRPPYAIIAGGRPDQAAVFEEAGIPTYLHVPSPGLLRMFLKDGARRFIFEGRECGGHVGPRSSFLLWETMVGVLLEHLGPHGKGDDLHIVFAGGIHDGLSAAMVSAIAAPLAARGAKIGGLMGTAYLFTREAVTTGAIVPQFQQLAVSTEGTVLLETAPGHAVRCVRTPYYDVFEQERQRLVAEGKSHEEIVRALEWMNIGRLRVASKGVDRVDTPEGGRRLAEIPAEEQFARGMYMIGQVAALRGEVLDMGELHEEVCGEPQRRWFESQRPRRSAPAPAPCDVAIIGMSSFYPGAMGLDDYWENLLAKQYAVTEVPGSHWDWRLYYDPDPLAPDRIVSKWGGFLGDILFDPLRYGITPKSVPSIEPLQLLLLDAVRRALEDARYSYNGTAPGRDWNRENTCAVLGIGGGGSPLAVLYGLRSCLPLLDTIEGLPIGSNDILKKAADLLPEWTEDSFPGFLLNVAVGRVANRFNFGGSNYALDAACASSLAAVHACVRELEMGTADVAVAMGADTVQTPYSYMAFSKTHALSPRGRCRPFDEQADGIVLSEGIGVVVLKRLADAERDGDTIYSVIRGVGSSSDGKDKGLTAPNAAGQLRALRRAYSKAGISPARVELIEAHGTGTVVGDQTEARSLTSVMEEAGADRQSCAVGSVKSMIGHSKCAAGIAGLIKGAKSLYHRVLPPTLAETPNSKVNFEQSALYLNTEARPWIHDPSEARVAGVSAFGFGGTNVHVVLEEYVDDYLGEPRPAVRHWPAELLVWRGADVADLRRKAEASLRALDAGAKPVLAELAASLAAACPRDGSRPTLAIVAESVPDAVEKLRRGLEAIPVDGTSGVENKDPRGVYYTPGVAADERGQVAFLFPGQGSQYPDMLADLAMSFDEVRETLDSATGVLADCYERPLGRYVYPASTFRPEEVELRAAELSRTDVAQPAIGACSLGLARLLGSLGVVPDCVAGHSYGELAALCVAGAIDEATALRMSQRRGALMAEAAGAGAGGMLALDADGAAARALIEGIAGVWLANFNGPRQTVVSGSDAALAALEQRAAERKVRAQRLPVACGFHSPLVAGAAEPFAAELAACAWRTPALRVFSNITAAPYPTEPGEVLSLLQTHLVSPVRFQDQVEAMHAAGVRTFVEVGPHQVLTGLVGRILGDRPHRAIALDSKSRRGLVQLPHAVAQLLLAGVPVDLPQLFTRRGLRTFDLKRLDQETGLPAVTPATWVVNGTRSRPYHQPERRLLGQSPEWFAERSGASPSASQGTPASLTAKSAPAKSAPVKSAPVKAAPAKAPANPTPPPTLKPALLTPAAPVARAAATSGPAPTIAAPAPATSASPPPTTAATPAAPHRSMSTSRPEGSPSHDTNLSPVAGRSPAAAHSAPAATDEASQVMLGFQDLMARFLDTQRAVMLSYLGTPEGAPPAEAPRRMLLAPATANGHAAPQAPAPAVAAPAVAAAPAPVVATTPAPVVISPAPAAPTPAAVAPAPAAETSRNGQHAPAAPAATASNHQPPATSHQPPAATPQPPATSHQADVPRSAEELGAQLLELVSARTGYPPEMLGLDLDLEADLGIDSIKRVEILGTMAESLGAGAEDESELSGKLELEKLTTIRTLRGIIEYLLAALNDTGANGDGNGHAATKPSGADAASKNGAASGHAGANGAVAGANGAPAGNGARPAEAGKIHRGLVELIPAPLSSGGGLTLPAGPVLMTDDGCGVAREVIDRLSDFGVRVLLVRDGDGAPRWDGEVGTATLTDPQAVAELVRLAREQFGRASGLLHLRPLSRQGGRERRESDVRSLYLLARALGHDLPAADQRGAVLLACTALGGQLGFGDRPLADLADACHGGVLGLTKSLAVEWPRVQVRAVDLDDSLPASELAERILAELADRSGPAEIGWDASGARWTWQAVDGTLELIGEPQRLGADDTLLITGGARGITAWIAQELARRYQPRMVLVGRSPLPPEESSETARLEGAAELKGALIEQLKREGSAAAPAEVESRYQRLLRDREIRRNMAAIREAGSEVEYHMVDVRDLEAMRSLLQDVVSRHGPLTGVLHGAGVIEDKLIVDKTPESFDRVVGTKIDSAFVLAELLDLDQLRFCVFFSSIAGRYGNKGQSDYSAANEVVAKLATELDRRSAGRVLAIDWGPWSGGGMVAGLEKHLAARGIALVTAEIGARMLAEELEYGPKGQAEVLIAGGAANLAQPTRAAAATS